jgi:nicotinamidase-related amidase
VLLDSLLQADQVFIAGEAGSHCVKSTAEHIAEHFDREQRSRLVLMADCMSPVPGFEGKQSEFLKDMAALGLQVSGSGEVLQAILANDRF